MTQDTNGQCFEIGLVMAGAISAGAYTAGVMDFLIQALDEWYAAKDAMRQGGAEVPPHDVKLKVMSGASAGGMTAAIATGALGSRYRPVTDRCRVDPANKLFDAWVNQIDITSLLGIEDLEDSTRGVRSLLDSTVLGRIAEAALDFEPAPQRRPYVDEPFHVIATVANLRGVPYSIRFRNSDKAGQQVVRHPDYVHFVVQAGDRPDLPGAMSLDWGRSNQKGWTALGLTALASGAFPVGLAPRTLRHQFSALNADPYTLRRWSVPGRTLAADGSSSCVEYRTIPPSWNADGGPFEYPYDYDYLCVDGGLFDNEPLELARRLLAGNDVHNPRTADEAKRAVILIDPFPSNVGSGDRGNGSSGVPRPPLSDDLAAVVPRLITAVMTQARFKPEELALAQDDQVYSRFLIAPSPAIASGSLGGFGGFLSRRFREHDFMLGRRNCQKFLQSQFKLAANNPLFDGWSDRLKRDSVYRDVESDQDYLPIIPCVGAASVPLPKPAWPRYAKAELEGLRPLLEARYDRVGSRLLDDLVGRKGSRRRIYGSIVRFERSKVLRRVFHAVESNLRTAGLFS